MSVIQIAIRILLADVGVTSLVSANIYPLAAPQEAVRPYVATSLVFEDQDTVLQGHRDGFNSRVSFACVAASLQAADGIAEAIKAAMSKVVNVVVMDGDGEPLATATAFKEGTDFSDFTDDRTVFRRVLDYNLRWAR
tara:strand:+ start:1878 stop:2288 length:411 start_codon:yes stop_codon:yes gene_type:complete